MNLTFPKWLLIFNSISTVNLRVYITCCIVLGTAITYWVTNNPPTGEWMFFMTAFSGIDVAQYATKRITFSKNGVGGATISQSTDTNDSEASTDVQELSQKITKG